MLSLHRAPFFGSLGMAFPSKTTGPPWENGKTRCQGNAPSGAACVGQSVPVTQVWSECQYVDRFNGEPVPIIVYIMIYYTCYLTICKNRTQSRHHIYIYYVDLCCIMLFSIIFGLLEGHDSPACFDHLEAILKSMVPVLRIALKALSSSKLRRCRAADGLR